MIALFFLPFSIGGASLLRHKQKKKK